jgi:hypothetical protein
MRPLYAALSVAVAVAVALFATLPQPWARRCCC